MCNYFILWKTIFFLHKKFHKRNNKAANKISLLRSFTVHVISKQVDVKYRINDDEENECTKLFSTRYRIICKINISFILRNYKEVDKHTL